LQAPDHPPDHPLALLLETPAFSHERGVSMSEDVLLGSGDPFVKYIPGHHQQDQKIHMPGEYLEVFLGN